MPKPAKRSLFHNYADPEGVTDLRDAREIPVARLTPNPISYKLRIFGRCQGHSHRF